MIEQEIKKLTEGLKMDVSPQKETPTKPRGGTVLEALEKLQTHAALILADAELVETKLMGARPTTEGGAEIEPSEAGIWDRLARKIVMIERVFAQIDEAHHHALASLK